MSPSVGALPRLVLFGALALAPVARVARGQEIASAEAAACDYGSCALGIVPTWNGLAVVRGSNGPRVANLNFFWPRSIESTLRGPAPGLPGADSAAANARRALRLRRIGALLTDAGLFAGVVTAARVVDMGRAGRGEQRAAGTALGALVLSVPFQFAADGALSRAVWWHNARFAR